MVLHLKEKEEKKFQFLNRKLTMDPNEVITRDSNLAELCEREYRVDASIPKNSPISDFFSGKTVFLTGPTGFLGHLLLEKILRYKCC